MTQVIRYPVGGSPQRRIEGLNTERPVHRTCPALFVPWSDAPGLSTHHLAVRSVGQEGGFPQWGVVHEHTRRPTPVGVHEHTKNQFGFSSTDLGMWDVGADYQHLLNLNNTTRQLPSTGCPMADGRPLQHCESRFWASSNPKFPVVHEQATPAASRTLGMAIAVCWGCPAVVFERLFSIY